MTDESYMNQAIALARKGSFSVRPNPEVGCVIVKNNKVLSTAYHEKYGEKHAERLALEKLSLKESQGATLYVTLEPCCHQGKTPPCTDIIIEKKIERVVIAHLDPNPLVSGKGVERLRKAGIQVDIGLSEIEAKKINPAFIYTMQNGIPLITWKYAMTLDGQVAPHKTTFSKLERQITDSKESIKKMHRLREKCDGIMIGHHTLLKDDPQLTARIDGKLCQHQPKRIIVTRNPEILLKSQIYTTRSLSPVIIGTIENKLTEHPIKKLKENGITVYAYPEKDIPLKKFLQDLLKSHISHILLEGGPGLAAKLLRENLIGEVMTLIEAKLLGSSIENSGLPALGCLKRKTMDEAIALENLTTQQVGTSIWISGMVKR